MVEVESRNVEEVGPQSVHRSTQALRREIEIDVGKRTAAETGKENRHPFSAKLKTSRNWRNHMNLLKLSQKESEG